MLLADGSQAVVPAPHGHNRQRIQDELNKLAAFLNRYPDRTVIFDGYTDSVVSEANNVGLSQRRADSVKAFLTSQRIASAQLSTIRKGESDPVAGNESAAGRQQNRRVEVVISNLMTVSR